MFRVLIACLLLLSAPANAQVPSNLADVELIPGWRKSDGIHVAGLSIRVAKGWKTYWRSPGDSGIPPRFNWSGSRNLSGAIVHFPVPQVFNDYGIRSIGYKDQVTFPIYFQPQNPKKPILLNAEIEIGVCDEICVPVTLKLRASLPAQGKQSANLKRLLQDQPRMMGAMRCSIEPIADGIRLITESRVGSIGAQEFAVVETGMQGVWVSEAILTRRGDTLRAEVEMVPPTARPFALARSDVRMTVLADGKAVELKGCE